MTRAIGRRLACVAMLIVSATATAGPVSELYISGHERIWVVQGSSVTRSWSRVGSHFESAMAVVDTVRTIGFGPSSTGAEYTLAGVPTGAAYTAPATPTPTYYWDGTTDGLYNYTTAYYPDSSTGALVGFDRDWTNPTALFTWGSPDIYWGSAYDGATDSVWLYKRSPVTKVENRALDGTLLSSFTVSLPSDNASGVALDPADSTLWLTDHGTSLYHYAQDGTHLGNEMVAPPFYPHAPIEHGAEFALPEPTLSTGNVDLGYALVGTSNVGPATATNTGVANSYLKGVFGDASGEFGPTTDAEFASVAQGASTTRNYSYTPTARGSDSQGIAITSNGGDATVTLSGQGVAPIIDATVTGAGLVRVGTSGTCSVTITNIGDGNLSGLGDPSDLHGTLGAMSSVFTGAGGSFDLGDGESISYNYSYDPLGRRYDSEGNPCSTSNGSPDGTNQAHAQSMTLTGQAVGPVFDSSVAVGSTIDFGAVTFGDTAMRFLDIMNVSDDPNGDDTTLTDLTLRWLGVTGPDASAFTIAGIPVGTELDQLDVETLGITFTSSGPQGERTATLEIRTDEGAPLGGDGEVFTFGLRGYATGASTVPEPATFSLLGLAALALARRRRR